MTGTWSKSNCALNDSEIAVTSSANTDAPAVAKLKTTTKIT